MRLFLDMSLGMSHKRFRVAVPAAWFTVDLPQVESVEDVDGPSSRGWFEYRLAARGTQQPQFHLRFWKNEIVFAQLTYRHRGAVGISDEAHATAMRRIVTLLSRRFGRPDRDRSDKQHISLGWNTNGALVEFEVSPDASHALSDVSLVRFHREKLAELKTWRAGVDMSEGTGPGYLLTARVPIRSLTMRAALWKRLILDRCLNRPPLISPNAEPSPQDPSDKPALQKSPITAPLTFS